MKLSNHPCKIGDIVYATFVSGIHFEDPVIEPYEVRYIAFDGEKFYVAGKDMELIEVGKCGAFLTIEDAQNYIRFYKSFFQTSGKVKKNVRTAYVIDFLLDTFGKDGG